MQWFISKIHLRALERATSSEAMTNACKWDHGLNMLKNQGTVEIGSYIQTNKFSAWAVRVPWDRTDCAVSTFTGAAWPGPTNTLPNNSWPQFGSWNVPGTAPNRQLACKHPGLGTGILLTYMWAVPGRLAPKPRTFPDRFNQLLYTEPLQVFSQFNWFTCDSVLINVCLFHPWRFKT